MLPVPQSKSALAEIEWLGGGDENSPDTWLGVTREFQDCSEWAWDGGSLAGDLNFLEGQDCQKRGVTWYVGTTDQECDFTVGNVDGVDFACSSTDGEDCARIAWMERGKAGAIKGAGEYLILDIYCTWTAYTVCAWYPSCGDGVVQGDEECDDGPGNGDGAGGTRTCVEACEALEGYFCLAGSSTVAESSECPAGFYCAGGNAGKVACNAPEGNYCPPVHRVGGTPRSSREQTEGVTCPAGNYCAGASSDKVPCTAAEGFYCPALRPTQRQSSRVYAGSPAIQPISVPATRLSLPRGLWSATLCSPVATPTTRPVARVRARPLNSTTLRRGMPQTPEARRA